MRLRNRAAAVYGKGLGFLGTVASVAGRRPRLVTSHESEDLPSVTFVVVPRNLAAALAGSFALRTPWILPFLPERLMKRQA